ncbi:unnamed protein product [Prunus armeniaca]
MIPVQCSNISYLKFSEHLCKSYASTSKVCSLELLGLFWLRHFSQQILFAVQNAIELLKTIGALDDIEGLLHLLIDKSYMTGHHLCTLPLDPNIGKMFLMGSIFQCLNPALTIAAALAHRDPFVLPINKKEDADAAKRSFAGDSLSVKTVHPFCVYSYDGRAKFPTALRTIDWSTNQLSLVCECATAIADLCKQAIVNLGEEYLPKRDEETAGTPFLSRWKVLIRAGLEMPGLDWTVDNFDC